LIEQPAILLPKEGPDAKPVPGEPTNRPVAPDEAKVWRRAEGLMASGVRRALERLHELQLAVVSGGDRGRVLEEGILRLCLD
jgi:hypothetical protein